MKMYTLRQVAAAAALSAAAGYFAGSSCEPMAERMLSARSGGIEERCRESQDSGMARVAELLAKRAVRRAAPALRSELGAGATGDSLIEYTFLVNGKGDIVLDGAVAFCRGSACPGVSELPELIGVLIASEWSSQPQAGGCSVLMRVEIPPVEAEAPQRRLRIPAGDRSVEL